MQEGDGGDLLIDGVVGIRHPQTPPELSRISIEHQHPLAVVLEHLPKPVFEQISLFEVASMADEIHAAALSPRPRRPSRLDQHDAPCGLR
jgi:hypothetical protein